jgi:hypothetical protein
MHIKKHVFIRDWTICSKFVNHSKFDTRHHYFLGGCSTLSLRRKRIFTMLMNKTRMSLKVMRSMLTIVIWICYLLHESRVSYPRKVGAKLNSYFLWPLTLLWVRTMRRCWAYYHTKNIEIILWVPIFYKPILFNIRGPRHRSCYFYRIESVVQIWKSANLREGVGQVSGL